MIEHIVEIAITYGIFAVLFIWLLYTTNKRNEEREEVYQEHIRQNQEIISEQAKSFLLLNKQIQDIQFSLISKVENNAVE